MTTETTVNPTVHPPENETYVDGVATISLRAQVAKIDCYQELGLTNDADRKEIRRISQRLVMPVSALYELHHILEKALTAIKESAEKAKAAAESKNAV